MAEKVASVYGFRILHEAYQVPKQGETESCGLRDVADVLHPVVWAGVRRVLGRDPVHSFSLWSGGCSKRLVCRQTLFCCLKALFNKCTQFRIAPARLPLMSHAPGFRCMSAHYAKQGWDLLPSGPWSWCPSLADTWPTCLSGVSSWPSWQRGTLQIPVKIARCPCWTFGSGLMVCAGSSRASGRVAATGAPIFQCRLQRF